MFPAERAREQFKEQYQSKSPSLHIPISWGSFEVVTGNLTETLKPQEIRTPGTLTFDALPNLGPRLFDEGDTLMQTLINLGVSNVGKLNFLRGASLQFGRKAHILFYEALVDQQPYPFVAYLSKGPKGTSLAREAENDYTNLTELAYQFDKRLLKEVKGKYDVIHPLALGYTTYFGKQYPVFTMPFLPYGELAFNAVAGAMNNSIVHAIPFFQYSTEYSASMAEIDNSQNQAALYVSEKLFDGIPNRELMQTSQAKRFLTQRDDLLRASALVYLLSERRFPKEYRINSGDWMVEISDDGLQLRLITIRGGYQQFSSEVQFYERIKMHKETPIAHQFETQPFWNLTRTRFDTIIEEAKALIA